MPDTITEEQTNPGVTPGSLVLDTYVAANYHTACDFEDFVIKARNDPARTRPPCPELNR